ncbi:hypothetical protein RclHR1_02140023 [Rhizophagus clarus]|uniref:Uncharacterized protein n=1 Tax=Rhizophagus clarus TaxID=94130 RepID=A0A2Z6QTE5_9GLOM|nr:hypothetical protein RclHR1_02140023 [Rhizophagus clarus]
MQDHHVLGSLVCQQRQAQSKVHRVTLLQETQFLSAHSVLHLWYWLKTIEEIPTLFKEHKIFFVIVLHIEGLILCFLLEEVDCSRYLELRRVVLYVSKGKLKARYIGFSPPSNPVSFSTQRVTPMVLAKDYRRNTHLSQ